MFPTLASLRRGGAAGRSRRQGLLSAAAAAAGVAIMVAGVLPVTAAQAVPAEEVTDPPVPAWPQGEFLIKSNIEDSLGNPNACLRAAEDGGLPVLGGLATLGECTGADLLTRWTFVPSDPELPDAYYRSGRLRVTAADGQTACVYTGPSYTRPPLLTGSCVLPGAAPLVHMWWTLMDERTVPPRHRPTPGYPTTFIGVGDELMSLSAPSTYAHACLGFAGGNRLLSVDQAWKYCPNVIQPSVTVVPLEP